MEIFKSKIPKQIETFFQATENLERGLKKGEDEEMPRETIQSAIRSMQDLASFIKETPPEESLKRRILYSLRNLEDDPSVTTALGALGVQFSGALSQLIQVIRPSSEEAKKVRKVDFDRLGGG
jgi:hypothetical protein